MSAEKSNTKPQDAVDEPICVMCLDEAYINICPFGQDEWVCKECYEQMQESVEVTLREAMGTID
jgi:hypothetical protein